PAAVVPPPGSAQKRCDGDFGLLWGWGFAGDEVGVDEGFGDPGDHVGQVSEFEWQMEVPGCDLVGEQRFDGVTEAALHGTGAAGDESQGGFGLACEVGAQGFGVDQGLAEASDNPRDPVATGPWGGLHDVLQGWLAQRPQDLGEELVAVADPAVEGGSVDPDLVSKELHVDSLAGEEPSTGAFEGVSGAGPRRCSGEVPGQRSVDDHGRNTTQRIQDRLLNASLKKTLQDLGSRCYVHWRC